MEIDFARQQAGVTVVASQYDRDKLLRTLERAGFKARVISEG